MRLPQLACFFAILCASTFPARAVVFLGTADPTHNTTTLGDNSGWQFEGQFDGFLGTPIAPLYFITAKHIGGAVGDSLVFHGETFTTIAAYPDPGSDLQIWQVDHAFPTYAPLYSSGGEVGQELRVIGRGALRGTAMEINNELKGWAWGVSDGVQRWGRNLVSSIYPSQPLLQVNFDNPGIADEAHLSVGDSGGAVFILEKGLWKLAGINYAVDVFYTAASSDSNVLSDLFDARGYYAQNGNGTFIEISGSKNVPSAFYSTRIYARLAWIESVTGIDGTTLPAETFSDWQHAYFTPAQLTDSTLTGPRADPDADGFSNLSEFAFNLDPTYNETVVMTASTGLRGFPLIRQQTIAATNDQRLTVEFVRRTVASGSGITYSVQFTSSLAPATVNWQPTGTEAVTAINPRWERVIVTDSVAASIQNPTRFARVVVTPTSP